jgi:hypothetical protein
MKVSCAGVVMKFTSIIGFLYDSELSFVAFEKILNPETVFVENAIIWSITLCSEVEVHRRFEGTYGLRLQIEQ